MIDFFMLILIAVGIMSKVFNFLMLLLQSFGIGYRKLHPEGQVQVHADDPRPIIRVRPDQKSGFRRYGFVDAVLGLDPVGKLGLVASDYRVCFYFFIFCNTCCMSPNLVWFYRSI